MIKKQIVISLAILGAGQVAHAGPYILAGTDADDHGSATATANLEGWLFMQKALENLATAPTLTNTNKMVVSLGSDAGTQAGQAAASAFGKSALAGSGWTFSQVSNLTNANFAASIASASIIMLDSSLNNVSGGLTGVEESVLATNASALNSFVGGGGGLFSQAGAYAWLSALVPGLVVNSFSDQGLTLTAAGSASFPGLKDADLSAGPWHADFSNLNGISTLATGIGNRAVIIGSSGGSFTNPVAAIPEPSTYALMALGLAGIGLARRRGHAKR